MITYFGTDNKGFENSFRTLTFLHSSGRFKLPMVAIPVAVMGLPSGSATCIPGCCWMLVRPCVVGGKKLSIVVIL